MTPENPAGLRDDVTTWQAAYLDLLGSWTALCDMAGVDGDSAPSEVIDALHAALAAAEPGLDVERLARALICVGGFAGHPRMDVWDNGAASEIAQAIAAEDARLREEIGR